MYERFETTCGINLPFLHWRHRQQVSSKFWYSSIRVHGATARRTQSLHIHCRQNLTCDNILRVSTSWSSAKIVREADLNCYMFFCFLSLQILIFSRPWLHVVNTVTDYWVSHRIAKSNFLLFLIARISSVTFDLFFFLLDLCVSCLMILFQRVGLRSTEVGILGWKQKIMKQVRVT